MRPFLTCRSPLWLLPLFLSAGALAQSDAGPESCDLEEGWQPDAPANLAGTLTAWQEEAAAHGAFGSAASFDLDGDDIHLNGDGLVVEAGQSLGALVLSGAAGSDYLFVSEAVVDGQFGTLVVQAPRISLAGTLAAPVPASSLEAATAAAPSVVRVVPVLESAPALGLDLSDEWAAAEVAAQAPMSVPLDLTGMTLSGYTRAMLRTTSGEVALTGAIVVESGGAVHTRASALLEASALSVAGDKLGVAGNFTAGTMTVEGSALGSVPKMVLVRGGPVVVTPSGAAASDVRVTQAFDEESPLLEATIEVVTSVRYLRVAEDDFEYLPIAVREAGFRHDALFGGIEVEGCLLVEGEESVQAVVEESWPGFVGIMISAIEASGWAAPIVAVAVIATLPGVMLLDAFVSFLDGLEDLFCWFGCPEPPPPPKAYPSWLEPGATGTAELVVHGNAPPGDYPTRVRLLGKNHPPAEINLLVRVGNGAVPEEWRCSVDAYGSHGACDCGCGAVDPDCPADAGVDACEVTWCASGPNLGGMPHPDDPTRCWTPPAEWSCPTEEFARADGMCDCGCGVADPDCPADATQASCTRTWCAVEGGQGGTLLDDSLSECHVAPPDWVCGPYSYAAGDGSCECGCGALDPDCPADATVEDCDVHICTTEVDPDDVAACLPPVEQPPAGDGGLVDEDDDSDDDAPRSCASASATSTEAPLSLVGLALLFGLVGRRARRARPRARAGAQSAR